MYVCIHKYDLIQYVALTCTLYTKYKTTLDVDVWNTRSNKKNGYGYTKHYLTTTQINNKCMRRSLWIVPNWNYDRSKRSDQQNATELGEMLSNLRERWEAMMITNMLVVKLAPVTFVGVWCCGTKCSGQWRRKSEIQFWFITLLTTDFYGPSLLCIVFSPYWNFILIWTNLK